MARTNFSRKTDPYNPLQLRSIVYNMSKTHFRHDSTFDIRLGLRMFLLLLIAYSIWRVTHTPAVASPPIVEIKNEHQLDHVLSSGNFTVIGVYNSGYCPKCLTYFLKWSRALVNNPIAASFNLSLSLIDQYSFRNRRNGFEDPLYISPSLFFFKGGDLFFFPNFTIEANKQTYWGATFRRLDQATGNFWNSTLPKLVRIDTFEQLLEELELHEVLVLFMGSQGNLFRKFARVATHNSDRTFVYLTDPDLLADVVIHYMGYLPQKPVYVAILRHQSILTRVDPNSFVIIEPFMDEIDLDKLIKLECLPRIGRNTDPEVFIQSVKDRLPVFAYVESLETDPRREEKLHALINFLLPRKKIAYSSIITSESALVSPASIFWAIRPRGNQDTFYSITNIGADGNMHVKMVPFGGEFNDRSLHTFFNTHITTRQVLSPGKKLLYMPVAGEMALMYKNVILGRIMKHIRPMDNDE